MLAKGVSHPPPKVFEGSRIQLAAALLPQLFIVDVVWPTDLENPSEPGVDENLDSPRGADSGSPSPGPIE